MSQTTASVQGNQITYELHSLGWKAFQDLCLTILAELLGQTVEVFCDTHDGGRDGAFCGTWIPKGQAQLSGSFTVQCKFTSIPRKRIALSDLADEIEKAAHLAQAGRCDNYLLMINQSLTAPTEQSLHDAFRAAGVKNFLMFGYEWLCLTIRQSSRLRMLVPRVYGLGDLSQILDHRAYDQTKEILDSIGDELKKFVRTEAHRKAAHALMDKGFVLLLGEPASGKSMIAAVLAVGANDRWNCFPIKVTDAADFNRHWNPNDPRQFFWVDDAFGTTQYQPETTASWNRHFGALSAAIRKGAKVLFTSRDYIFRAARRDIKESAFPLLAESQVIIDVQSLK